MSNVINEDVIEMIRSFTKERDWEQFHTGENLAKSISIEANELLELFQWSEEAKSIDDLKEELADVFTYCIMMADKYQLDINSIIIDKMKKNAKKYPVEKAKGNNKKYTEL